MTVRSFNQNLKTQYPTSILDDILRENVTSEFRPVRIFKKNEIIYQAGARANQIYVVQEGRVKVGILREDDKQLIKMIAEKGDFFGEHNLIGQDERTDYAIAMETTKVLVLDNEILRLLMRRNFGLSLKMMEIIGGRLAEAEQRLEDMVFKSSKSRIIKFLKKIIQKSGQRVGYEMVVRKFFTHQEVANLTATSRQTVTTVLNDLRKRNILTFNRRRLLIRNMESLSLEMEGI